MKDRIIKLRHGIQLYIHESTEKDPIGVIIDVYDKDMEQLYDSYTIDYDSVKFEFEDEDDEE